MWLISIIYRPKYKILITLHFIGNLQKEKVNAVTSLIDPEIMLLAKNRQIFIENGILPLVPDKETAEICFDKYKMYEYLTQKE